MSHDIENWGLLQTLFELAENASPQDRERLLMAHCADERVVRRALQILEGSEHAVQSAGKAPREPSAKEF